MGDKLAARATVARAGVPLVPGTALVAGDAAGARRQVAALGYPVLVKAAGGGGGKGMRTVASEDELTPALAAASREAEAAFGDGRVYVEKLLRRPRHVEVQVLGDRHGTLVHLGERECSIQRRHQKIVEETPCPVLTPRLRAEMTAAALAAARAVGYTNAGTVEFLLDADGRFYFLEMNTRVQVEHPITEWVTGVDIVAAQLRIAAGQPLGFAQSDVVPRGHAIEVRLYAEDPARSFFPSPGPILALSEPSGPGVRVDSGVVAGGVVPVEYDPLLAKISAWAPDRTVAVRRLRAALEGARPARGRCGRAAGRAAAPRGGTAGGTGGQGAGPDGGPRRPGARRSRSACSRSTAAPCARSWPVAVLESSSRWPVGSTSSRPGRRPARRPPAWAREPWSRRCRARC